MKQSLRQSNTFGVDSYTSNLVVINQTSDIQKLIQQDLFEPDNFLFLGGGSNLLLLDDVADLVIAMRMEGIDYQTKADDVIIATIEAGVNWHQLVKDSLSKGFYGLENLALIPGSVGAAPIQNIGAYGVEICERFISLTAINLCTAEEKIFSKDECQFSYRDSLFKHDDGKYYLITSVQLALSTRPSICIDYKALKDSFADQNSVTAEMVFDEVCRIRNKNLPDPEVLGNAGSFFKNPIVDGIIYHELKQQFPDLIAYPQSDKQWKLAAGWMIDRAGLKGYRIGNVGVHTEQALVLVNYGGATGSEVANLGRYVQHKIQQLFSITLDVEVTIVGSTGVIDLRDID